MVIPFRTLKSKHDFSMSQGPMWQFLPPYLVAQDVHVHVPVVPPALPPLMHQKVPSLPSLAESDDAVHGSGSHVAAVSTPKLHDDGPDTVYPVSHVG